MLRGAVKSAVIKELSEIELYLLPSTNSDVEILKLLCNNNVINNIDIEQALEKSVLRRAVKDYFFILKGQYSPNWSSLDHHIVPEYFAYAIEKGLFSEKELKKIQFENGETSEDFVREFGKKNLLSHLRENLLNPPKF